MLKGFRLICVSVFFLSIFLSKIFVYSLNVSNIRNVPSSRQLLREEQTEMPILFNLTLDYLIPRRRLLDDTTSDTNFSNIENSTILDGSIYSTNTLIDLSKDIETTWTIDQSPTLSSISNDIESFSSTPESQETVTHVRRKRNALTERNHLENKEETEENEKIDRKRHSLEENHEKVSSTDEQDEVSNIQNSEDDELDDYNAVNEKSSVDAEESNENEENLGEDASQEETASNSNDPKIKRESSDYEYVDDQENSSNDKKITADVRVKREDENVKLEDDSVNEAKISELGNLETNLKDEEVSGKILENQDSKIAENQDSKNSVAESQDSKNSVAESQDSKVSVAESQDSKVSVAENQDSKRDALKKKTDSVESSKEPTIPKNNGKDDTVIDTKSKEEDRETRTASGMNDNYEKRVEEQIKRKIDSIKEEIKREIERKRRDREIERNNAKFDELQSRDSDQEEGESLEPGQNLDEGIQSKRSLENNKESIIIGRRKRRSNENESTKQQLEEIEGVENLKDEDYRLAGLTHESIQKRFAPVYEEEEINKVSLKKTPVKKREKVRQMFIVKDEGKRKRKKRGGEARETKKIRGSREIRHPKNTKIQGKKRKRKVSNAKQVLVPEQARVKIIEEFPGDLTLDPRLRRSLPFNNGKQVRIKRENEGLEGRMVDLEYRPQNIEDEENDEGNEFGDDGFEDRTSNFRDSLADRRLYEEREGEENDQPLNFLFSGIHD